MMRIEHLVRHHRLVSDVGVSHRSWNGLRGDVQSRGQSAAFFWGIEIIEQIRIAVLQRLAMSAGRLCLFFGVSRRCSRETEHRGEQQARSK